MSFGLEFVGCFARKLLGGVVLWKRGWGLLDSIGRNRRGTHLFCVSRGLCGGILMKGSMSIYGVLWWFCRVGSGYVCIEVLPHCEFPRAELGFEFHIEKISSKMGAQIGLDLWR